MNKSQKLCIQIQDEIESIKELIPVCNALLFNLPLDLNLNVVELEKLQQVLGHIEQVRNDLYLTKVKLVEVTDIAISKEIE